MVHANVKTGLFTIRASLAIFFAVWAGEKFVNPETTVAIWKAFYLVENLPLEASYLIGAVQALVVICFALGLFKFWTYGFFMVIHGLGTLSTYARIFDPYAPGNHLFVAAIPVLGALIALFIMRNEDTMFSLAKKKRALN